MYVKESYLENLGPLRQLALEFPFTPEGLPKPVLLVGQNGGGKTTLLSVLADSLFEAAAPHYSDVVPSAPGLTRHWFRVSGANVTRQGAPGTCALLRFDHDGTPLFYKERSGRIPVAELRERVSPSLRHAIDWSDDNETTKSLSINLEQSHNIFGAGAYVFFPSSRSETPDWLNTGSLSASEFDLQVRFSTELRKPIYVERAFDKLKQWLLALLLDARIDFSLHVDPGAQPTVAPVVAGNWATALTPKSLWDSMNTILRAAWNDTSVSLGWAGRNVKSLVVHRAGIAINASIDSLSAGQSGLLNVFGTLLRYGDMSGSPSPAAVQGICLVDEIEAHMHVDLQYRALPSLVSMFPRVQFVVATHSPLFVLGMEQKFGVDGISIFEIPSGVPIQAEAFSEFGHALDVLRNTTAFNDVMAAATANPGKLLVLLEGETDPKYIKAAVELLNRTQIFDVAEFEWIGGRQDVNGQGFNTGKSALNSAFNLFRAKPALLHRPVLLLYDNDANKSAFDTGRLHVRSMPTNAANADIENGVENLLRSQAIGEPMYDVVEKRTSSGGKTVIKTLNKMRLCDHLCVTTRSAADFTAFAAVLDIVHEVARSAE